MLAPVDIRAAPVDILCDCEALLAWLCAVMTGVPGTWYASRLTSPEEAGGVGPRT